MLVHILSIKEITRLYLDNNSVRSCGNKKSEIIDLTEEFFFLQ